MIAIVLALLAALALGLSAVLVRKRLDESNVFSATLVIAATGNIVLWPFALLFTNLNAVNLEGVLFFVIAGILGTGFSRLVYFKAVDVVGVSVSSSIAATSPMYSSILAFLLLNEVLVPENWVGLIFIVVGVVYLERSLGKPKTGPKRIFRKNLVFPVLVSLTLAFAFIVRKHALNIYNEPLLGVAIAYSSSLLLYLPPLILSSTTRSSLSLRKDFQLFWKAGVCMSLGWISIFYALSQERVSIVTSLTQTHPLFVLFFAYLYLKELEPISLELIVSSILIVIGVMLVSVH